MTGSYVEVPYPWRAAIARGRRAPARHYVAIVAQAVRYGLPAQRRPAALWTQVARRRLPEAALARAIERLPGRPRPDLDALLDGVRAGWDDLEARGAALPARPPEPLSALSLERRAARTVFVFGDGPAPLLVLKVPYETDAAMAAEGLALKLAEPAGIAPRSLGRVGTAYAQSVVPGAPLAVQPLGPAAARSLAMPAGLASALAGLERLNRETAVDGPPGRVAPLLDRAAEDPALTREGRRRVAAAAERISGLERSVLGHRDTSPQNIHCVGDEMAGLVDWELADARYLPGLDLWIAGLSYLEHCVGLREWSPEAVLGTFEAAWRHSPFFAHARSAARDAVAAAGLEPADADALEVGFFAIRLAYRRERPQTWPTSPDTAARMLEIAAAG